MVRASLSVLPFVCLMLGSVSVLANSPAGPSPNISVSIPLGVSPAYSMLHLTSNGWVVGEVSGVDRLEIHVDFVGSQVAEVSPDALYKFKMLNGIHDLFLYHMPAYSGVFAVNSENQIMKIEQTHTKDAKGVRQAVIRLVPFLFDGDFVYLVGWVRPMHERGLTKVRNAEGELFTLGGMLEAPCTQQLVTQN